jgi:hypothetical protein
METLKVNSDVPPPNIYRYNVDGTEKKIRCKYPFGDFEVGNSMFVATDLKSADTMRKRLMSNAHGFNNRAGVKWRWVSDIVEGGVRIWRIA